MDPVHNKISQALLKEHQTRAVLVTVVATRGSVPRETGSKMVVYADGATCGTIGGGSLEAAVLDQTRQVERPGLKEYHLSELGPEPMANACGGSVTLFFEPLQAPPTLLLIGGGHIGQALARHASFLGMRVVAVEDRADKATAENLPWAHEIIGTEIPATLEKFPIDGQTYIAVVTRSPQMDQKALLQLHPRPWAYLGLLGSRRRVALVLESLRDQGVPEETLARIHAPIGLDIDADTPEEIAISILAEIVQVRRGGTGLPLSQAGR